MADSENNNNSMEELKHAVGSVYIAGHGLGKAAYNVVQEIDWEGLKTNTVETMTNLAKGVKTAYDVIIPPPAKNKPRFTEMLDFDTRVSIFQNLIKEYPYHIPVIIERAEGSRLSDVCKRKYLVTRNSSLGNLFFKIRSQIVGLNPHQGIYFNTINGSIASPPSILICDIYNKIKSEDGFIYLFYKEEKHIWVKIGYFRGDIFNRLQATHPYRKSCFYPL